MTDQDFSSTGTIMIPEAGDEQPSHNISFVSPFTIATDDQGNGAHVVTYPDSAPHLELEIVRTKPVSVGPSLSPLTIAENQWKDSHLETSPGRVPHPFFRTKPFSAIRLSPLTIAVANKWKGKHWETLPDGEQHRGQKIVGLLPVLPFAVSTGGKHQTDRLAPPQGRKSPLRRIVLTGKSTRRLFPSGPQSSIKAAQAA